MKELNEMKLREINGGVIGIDDFLYACAVGAVLEIIHDWNNFERGFKGQPYIAK